MRKTKIGSRVRRGLLKSGFDRNYADRIARELDEHWLDLFNEGLRHGLPESEAEARATDSIGTAEPLIEEFTARMQRCSWLGRHPVPGFALLALVATIFWWALLIIPIGSAAGLFVWGPGKPVVNLISNQTLSTCFDWIRRTSYFVPPWFICFVARRFHCGWKAALWGCLVLSVHNTMHSFAFSGAQEGHGTISWGYGFNFGRGPVWLPLCAPLVVFVLDLLWTSRAEPRTNPQNHS